MAIHKLTKDGIRTATKPICDGGGLWLIADATGPRSWSFRFMLNGRSREMGLGSAGTYTIEEARAMAVDARKLLDKGIDPIEARKQQAAAAEAARAGARTFEEVAFDYLRIHAPEWKNAKHTWQVRATLEKYAFPTLGKLAPKDITTPLIKAAIEPIWLQTTETARRTLDRVEAVLDLAISSGLRDGPNPARWDGHMKNLFPKQSSIAPVRHHPALPFNQVHTFMTELRTRAGIASRALEFLILTGVRSGPVRLATWAEIDGAVWRIPAAHMKGMKGREQAHSVPLSKQAMALLASLERGADDDLIFASANGTPISDMAMTQTCRRLDFKDSAGEVVVPHGFRSTIRDWCRSKGVRVDDDVAEDVLAHVEGDKVQKAYKRDRGTLFELRIPVMQRWADYIDLPPVVPSGNVVEIWAAS